MVFIWGQCVIRKSGDTNQSNNIQNSIFKITSRLPGANELMAARITNLTIEHVTLVAIIGATKLVFPHLFNSLQLIWGSSILNSLRPRDAIWQRSGSPLAQVMACCLMAPSHYLNQCWLIIDKVEWHSSKGKFTRDTSGINHSNYLEN